MSKINLYEVTFINTKKKEVEEPKTKCWKSYFGIPLADYHIIYTTTQRVKIAASSFDEVYKKAKKYSKDEIKEIEFEEEIEF